MAVAVGIATGYLAVGLHYAIDGLTNYFLLGQKSFESLSPAQHSLGPLIVAFPVVGILFSYLVTKFFSSENEGHGVPEVIESVLLRSGRMPKRTILLKGLTSAMTISTGGSVGPEGPIVQMGSATGSALAQILNFSPQLMKTLVGCGAAGGLAASFNTPIAGVIFAIEIIVLELKTKSFVPLVISSVFATIVGRSYLGDQPVFPVPDYSLVNNQELIFYFGLAIVSGIVGFLAIRVLDLTDQGFKAIPFPGWAKAVIGGLIIGGLAWYQPLILGIGYETVGAVLKQNSSIDIMAALVLLKILASSVTLSAGGSGGLFAPSLFIGAMLGGSFGYLADVYFPGLTGGYGAYALVGMAAVFSAMSRATLTAILIVFEMTLEYQIIIPLLLVCVVADQVSWVLSKDSIYSLPLRRKGLSFVNDIGVNIMSVTFVRDIMTTKVDLAHDEMTLDEAKSKLIPLDHTVYPVTDRHGVLNGVVHYDDILKDYKELEKVMKIKDIKRTKVAVCHPDDTVQRAISKIEKTRDPRIIVVDRKTKKLMGIASPIDFVRLSSNTDRRA